MYDHNTPWITHVSLQKHDTANGLNWHWTPYARMQFNYIHGRIEDSWARGREVNRDDPLVSGSYDIIGARFMVDF